MQPETVAAESSGDSGWAWSRIAAASCGVVVGDGFGGEPQGDGGQFAGVPDRGEHGHVVPLDRPG